MRRKDYGGIEGATVALYHAGDLLQEATRLAEDEQLDQLPGGAGCRPPPRCGRHAQDGNDRTEKGKDSND